MRYRLLFLVLMSVIAVQSWGDTMSIDFEDVNSTYEDNWVFENILCKQKANNKPTHGGSYYGTINNQTSASIRSKNKVAKPLSIIVWVATIDNSTTTSTWQVQVSTDGNNWTNVENAQDANVISWTEFSCDLSSYTDVFVRVVYSGSSTARRIDDLLLISENAATEPTIIGPVTHGAVAVGDVIRATDHEGNYIDDGFEYKVLSVNSNGVGTAEVCNCTLSGVVTIPSSMYCSKDPVCTNFKIENLGRDFDKNKTITKLILSEGITSTGFSGTGYPTNIHFYLVYMTNLRELVIPKTTQNMFIASSNGYPYKLKKITIDPENPYIDTIKTVEGSTIVRDKATNRIHGITTKDKDGNDITSLTIPEGITGLYTSSGYMAYVLCSGGAEVHKKNMIETITLPSTFGIPTVTTTNAKNDSTNNSNYYNNTVIAMGFMYNLKQIKVADGNSTFCAYNGLLYTNKISDKEWGSTLFAVPKAWNPDNSTDLTFVSEEGVSEFRTYCMYGSRYIKHIKINDTQAGGVKLYPQFVNYGPNLLDITLPGCAEYNNFLCDCSNLKDITIDNTKCEEHGHTATCQSEEGILYSPDKKTALLCPAKHIFKDKTSGVETKHYKAPDETTTIAANAFFHCTNIESLDLNNVTKILSRGFRDTRLTTLDLKKVTYVGAEAFLGNTLTSVDLSSVDTIEYSAFHSQKYIKEITIPLSCSYLGSNCFIHSPLTKLEFEGAIPATKAELDGQKKLFLSSSIFHSSNVTEVIIPSRAYYHVGSSFKDSYSTFGNCEKIIVGPSSRITNFNFFAVAKQSLKEVEFIPNFENTENTHTIYERCFYGYNNLEKVTGIPINTTIIGQLSFAYTPKLTTVTFAEGESKLTELKSNAFLHSTIKTFAIPNGVKTLGQRIFSESTLEEVNLPKTMTSIDPLTFDGCASLKAINVSEENTKYSSLGGMVMSKDKKKIVAFPQGKSQDGFTFLPPVVETIGQFAFFNSQNLKSVVLPRSIKKIENKAFECCYNLTDIYLMGGASTADDAFATDAAADDAKGTETEKDHRFGDPDVSSRDFLRNKVTVHYLSTTSGSTTGYFTGQETKAKETAKAVSLGEGRAVGQYYITNEEDKGNTAMFVGARNEDGDATDASYSYVVPATVKIGDVTYNVNRIADFAFEGQTEIPSQYKEVILRGNYDYIGAKLFGSSSSVQSVFYAPESGNISTPLCEKTSRYEYGLTADYNSIPSKIKCYVPKTEYNAWTEYTGGDASKNTLSSNLAYQIPFPVISTKFGTFSREFDVDLQDNNGSGDVNWNSALNKPSVIAFTGYEKTTTDDKGVQHIIMTSINNGATDGTDGTYIPANTGVLLRAYTDNSQSPSGFYYRIGEKSMESPGSNVMQCVTETSRSVSPTETIGGTTYTNYVISGGKYYSLSSAITIPAHKSYLHIPTPSGAKGIMLVFEDEGSTGIRAVEDATLSNEDVIYDLQGRRVTSPSKGLYIVNGRKVVMR